MGAMRDKVVRPAKIVDGSFLLLALAALLTSCATGVGPCPQPPVAVAAASPTEGDAELTVTFDGSASEDPDGEIVSWEWDFGDGATAGGVTVVHTYVDDGLYIALLTVTDNDGYTARNTVTVTVRNPPPLAELEAWTVDGYHWDFDASGSVDPAAVKTQSIVLYQWDFGDGAGAVTAVPTAGHTYCLEDDYTVALTVTDDDGATAVGTKAITVAPAADEDLVLFYRFEEIVEGAIPDVSGHGHHGEINGSVTLESGPVCQVARFATGSFLDLDGPHFPVEEIPKEAITIAVCAKITVYTGDAHAIFNARASDGTWVVHPEFRADRRFRWCLRAYGMDTIFDIRATPPEGPWKVGRWYHFAGVYNAADRKGILYINGEPIGEASTAGELIAGDWALGARVGYNIDNARPFTGLMDNFMIYRRALSPEEISQLADECLNR